MEVGDRYFSDLAQARLTVLSNSIIFQSRTQDSLNGKTQSDDRLYRGRCVSIPHAGFTQWKERGLVADKPLAEVSIPHAGFTQWKVSAALSVAKRTRNGVSIPHAGFTQWKAGLTRLIGLTRLFQSRTQDSLNGKSICLTIAKPIFEQGFRDRMEAPQVSRTDSLYQ